MSIQAIQETVANYFKTQPVLKAWLFGSYSRGEQRPWSEVDLVEEGMLRPWAVESVNRDRKLIYERAFLSKTAPRLQDGA